MTLYSSDVPANTANASISAMRKRPEPLLPTSADEFVSATADTIHVLMHQGLSELCAAVLEVERRRHRPTTNPAGKDRQVSELFHDVLALACRMLVLEWSNQTLRPSGSEATNNPADPHVAQPEVQLAPARPVRFPYVSNSPLNDEPSLVRVPLSLSAVVRCAQNMAERGVKHADACGSAWEWLLITYERALQLIPTLTTDGLTLSRGEANQAHARRTSGSYYTPMALVESTLDAALDPVIEDASVASGGDPAALLRLRLVDPACGTGRFLVAAAHRLTQRLMAAQGITCEPRTPVYKQTYAQVVRTCICGVDVNPITVEWCKLSLLEPIRDQQVDVSTLTTGIRVGHALLGAPRDFEYGIPQSAWATFADDDKPTAGLLRRRHQAAMEAAFPEQHSTNLSALSQRTYADIWCGAFFMPKRPGDWERMAPTHDRWLAWRRGSEQPCEEIVSEARLLARRHSFFHWAIEYLEVFQSGGFDVVLGNPPWIAHAGRAAQPLEPRVKQFYSANYEAFCGYPTTHALFVSLAARLLRSTGRMGLIVPSSVSELDGYKAARREHDRLCELPHELQDFGEGMFTGVTQPCMALVSQRTQTGRTAEHGSVWPLQRPDLSPEAKALLQRLGALKPLPPELFGERGLQTDAVARSHLLRVCEPNGRFTTPIREGTDVQEFELGAARWHVDPVAVGSRLRAASEYRKVHFLVRQTARYPIAAFSDGVAFRNSLLAGYANDEWCAAALVSLLNSALVRWMHYARFRDARQPVLPQVKIGHLRAIPAPPNILDAHKTRLAEFALRLSEQPSGAVRVELRRDLDALVYELYELCSTERALIEDWHRAHRRFRDG